MRIAILVEGSTEKVFIPHLRAFLENHLSGRMPRLDPIPQGGRIPTNDKLRRIVDNALNCGSKSADAVIALTDVYTGSIPPDFIDAADAKAKMSRWVGSNPKFHPHAAQHDFEAWLLPYWDEIQKITGNNQRAPSGPPENVNHKMPPSKHIEDIFRRGSKGRKYVKTRDAHRILRDMNLTIAAKECPELKSFLNTILRLCDGELIP